MHAIAERAHTSTGASSMETASASATAASSAAATTASPPLLPAPMFAADDRSSFSVRKELDMRLTAYLPAVVRRHLEKQDLRSGVALHVPDTHQATVVSMFADVSGFTAMTESLAARGPVGAEFLAKHLNSYFEQLLRHVSSAGGDVFKFAGDAMLIFWPENKDDTLESLLRRAVQCALRIQSHLHKAELAPGVVLSVKMGIGIGGATIAHLGGESDGAIARVEYIAVGPALEQAFNSEHHAEPGDVICSPESWRMVQRFFDGERVRAGSDFYKVAAVRAPIRLCSRRPSFTRDDALLHARMKQYVSRAVWPYLDAHDEFWGSELRDVTVLFINLGFCEEDLAKMLDIRGLEKLQAAFALVQRCIYEYEGTINKFLVDDKGSTVIAAFGLPPVTHENDPVRGILASLAICAALTKLELKASVGITTGTALCGVVGHQGNRREYTVLGDIVNLSARLMQKAKSENGGVITDESTKLLSENVLHFEERPEIMVKGKNDSIKIHRPYPRMSTLLAFHLSMTAGSGVRKQQQHLGGPGQVAMPPSRPTQIPNVMDSMHRVQVRDAQRKLSVRADREAATAGRIIESDNFRKVRDALLEKCSELNPFSPGGSFVLEGDIGVGKTVLLRAALASPEAGAYNVLQGTTTPFATRKPYAIWADMITKCALEQAEMGRSRTTTTTTPATPPPPPTTTTTTTKASPKHQSAASTMASIMPSQTPVLTPGETELSREADRRRHVAQFVRRKIKDGAAPNTTLVAYAKLLNGILDTDFDAFTREDDASDERASSASKSIKLLESDVWGLTGTGTGANRESSNQDGHDQQSQQQQRRRGSTNALMTTAPPQMDSPGKSKMKEEEIAAWFLGLLEMDLARSRSSSGDFRALAPIDETAAAATGSGRSPLRVSGNGGDGAPSSATAGTIGTAGDDECEPEWTPTDLDLSGILLLCALHALSRTKSTVFCLDNAMYMDEKSWILATIIAKYFTNCVVVIGTRPPSLALSENTESSSFRKRLRVLKRMRSSVCQTLEPLCGADVEQLAVQTLHVHDIPRELMAILVSRSQGNPLFLRELITEMCQQQVIKVDSKHRTCQMQVQEPWGDKSHASICFQCHTKFAASKDKHRCKCCGYIFCAACTPKACQRKIPGVRDDPVRHCHRCYQLASTRRPSSDRSLAAAVNAVTSGTFGQQTMSRHRQRVRSMFTLTSSSSSSSGEHAATPAKPLAALKDRIALRPPRTVKSVLTTLLDQLTVSQRMLMKTASVIGAVFDEELLRGSCPIAAHLSRFGRDIDELERLAMIRRIDTFVGRVPAGVKSPCAGVGIGTGEPSTGVGGPGTASTPAPPKLKVKFEFGHGFMQDVLRSQMLCSQLDKLNARVAECREQQERELRRKHFEKASASLLLAVQPPPSPFTVATNYGGNLERRRGSTPINGPILLAGSHGGAARRALTPTANRSGVSRFFSRTHSSAADQLRNSGTAGASAGVGSHSSSSAESSAGESSSSTQLVLEDGSALAVPSQKQQQLIRAAPAFVLLKSGCVYVKKHSSVLAHIFTNTRQWKKRFAVLQNARLLLQYDEQPSGGSGGNGTSTGGGAQPRQGTTLFLKGAKVSVCDPEVVAKVNCFQVEVTEWTKGRHLKTERRVFVLDAQSEQEVGHWVFMLRYAIESLENQQQLQQQQPTASETA